jgi:hypothetical protein
VIRWVKGTYYRIVDWLICRSIDHNWRPCLPGHAHCTRCKQTGYGYFGDGGGDDEVVDPTPLPELEAELAADPEWDEFMQGLRDAEFA